MRLLLVLCAALAAAAASAQPLPDRLDAYATAAHDADRFVGSVLVASGDTVVYERGFGLADASWTIPNAPDTRHRIGSLTKQFTAALVMQLVEAGEVDLDAPVTRYLDYPAEQGDRLRVRHLLSHTGGLTGYTALPGYAEFSRVPTTPAALVARFSADSLHFEPGSQFAYSNSGYAVLGAIVEAVTGRAYADALRQRLLDPLGLADTGYDDQAEVRERMARGYERDGLGLRPAPYVDPSVPYAAGMMYATVRDLHAWTRALWAGRPFRHAETLRTMLTPGLGGYGYGVALDTLAAGDRAVPVVMHTGAIPGFGSALVYAPETEVTVAVVSNREDNPVAMARALVAVAHGGEAAAPQPRLAVRVLRIVEDEGVEAAAERVRAMRAEGGVRDEAALGEVGRELLRRGDLGGAVRMLRLGAELFPWASLPHVGLGEAYRAAGDDRAATASYVRALAIAPTDSDARAALQRLGVDPPAREPVALAPEDLDAFVGRYALALDFVLAITHEGGRLYLQATGQSQDELVPVTEQRFEITAWGVEIAFWAGDGPSPALTLYQHGQVLVAERVD